MSNFEKAIEFVLEHEGGYFKDDSTGEEVNFGITKKFLGSLGKNDNVKNITLEHAKGLYRLYFWDKMLLDQVPSLIVSRKLLDMSVNMGIRQATRLWQFAVNSMGQNIHPDGIPGLMTIHATQWLIKSTVGGEERLLEELRLKSIDFYKSIAVGVRSKYLEGWLARANDVGNLEDKSHEKA